MNNAKKALTFLGALSAFLCGISMIWAAIADAELTWWMLVLGGFAIFAMVFTRIGGRV